MSDCIIKKTYSFIYGGAQLAIKLIIEIEGSFAKKKRGKYRSKKRNVLSTPSMEKRRLR